MQRRSRTCFLLILAALASVSCKPQGIDLRMTLLDVPTAVRPGDPVTIVNRVCNGGTQPADPSDVEFHLRPVEPTGPDVLLFGRPVPALAAGACDEHATEMGTPWGLPDGAYRLVAVADSQGFVDDVQPGNNTAVSDVLGLGWQADLVVTDVMGSASVLPGGSFAVQAEVCNQGFDWSSATQATIYLSSDAVIEGVHQAQTQPDTYAGMLDVAGIPPGGCAPAAGMVPAPWDPGVFFLGAIIDEFDAAPELIESNNAGTGSLIAVGDGADLVVDSLAGPPSAMNGSGFDVDTRVCNQGTAVSTPSGLAIHLSADAFLMPSFPDPAGGDPQIGYRPVPGLAPGECHAATAYVNAWAPEDGAYHLGAYVDDIGTTSELREDNNALIGGLIGIGYEPDLVVASLAAPPSADGSFDVDVEVCNQGTAGSGHAAVHLYLSEDGEVDPDPADGDLEVGGGSFSQLEAGECQAATWPAWASGVPGPHFLLARVDAYDDVPELVESNNDAQGPLMGIGFGPDLLVAAIAAPPSAEFDFDATVTVCNQGTAPSPASEVALYHSPDPIIQGEWAVPGYDFYAGHMPVPPLGEGACSDVSGPLWVSVFADGAYTLGAIVDEHDALPELIETNNTFAGPQMGLGLGPDLVIAQMDAPPSAAPGGEMALQVEVCNQGTAASEASVVSLYLSDDPVLDDSWSGPGDPPLGNVPVAALASGECRVEAATAYAWVPSDGAWYLAASVDEAKIVAELNEANNEHVGELIGVGTAPDLVVTSISAPTAVPNGTPFDAQVEICNPGQANALGAHVELYLSLDDEITSFYNDPSSPDVPVGGVYLGDLAPGACVSAAAPLWAGIPPGSEGSWLLGGIVDDGNAIPELIESNNVLVGDPLEITPGGP